MAFEKKIYPILSQLAQEFKLNESDVHTWYKTYLDGKKVEEKPKPTSPKKKVSTTSADTSVTASADTSVTTSSGTPDLDVLKGMTKPELSNLCKAKGFKVSGKKEDLIDRLLGKEVSKPKTSTPKELKQTKITDYIQKTKKETDGVIQLRRNKHQNLVHEPTQLVFDTITKKVIGKQHPTENKILPLTDEDFETCNQYKFSYFTPENLDAGKKNEVIEELNNEDANEEEIVGDDGDEDLEDGDELEEEEEIIEDDFDE